MSARRPDLFAPLPIGYFRHPKIHRVRQVHPHAAEGYLVLVAEAEAQTRRRGDEDPGYVKMLHADFCLCLGIDIDRGAVGGMLNAYEEAGWIDLCDEDGLAFYVRLLNFREWAANRDRLEPKDLKQAPNSVASATNDPKQASRFSKDPANKGVEISRRVEVEVEVDSAANPAREIFEHWRVKCGHEKARYGQDRAKHINARLREGYTVADLKQAIDGCAASEWHMGKNPQRVKYDELSRIVANSEQVDKFMARAGITKPTADDFFKRNGM